MAPRNLERVTAASRRPGTVLVAAASAVALAGMLAGCASPRTREHDAGADRAGRLPKTTASAAATPRTSVPHRPVGTLPLPPARGRGHLAPGSDPRALPGDVLIADEDNGRLLLVDPHGRIRWRFPDHGLLPGGQPFGPPDDAFFAPNGRAIIATQELNNTVSVIGIAAGRVVRRYGHPGIPGSAPGFFSHPDDAMLLPGGDLLVADIMNCRILLLSPGRWHVVHQLGRTGSCAHAPPARFGSPNGFFPLKDGHFLVTEISNDWVDEMSLGGRTYWSTHPPGVSYPSDANEVSSNRYIVADYSYPGQIVIFNRAGHALWRFRPHGAHALNHPSLALPLPNGNILVNDDYNDRVIVIDPKTKRVVWQYGHYGVPGRSAGYLDNPDGVDLAPPNSLLTIHAATLPHP